MLIYIQEYYLYNVNGDITSLSARYWTVALCAAKALKVQQNICA